jgi:replicative DNA helicase
VRIIVEVQDLPPGRTHSYTVAGYVRAVLALSALRRELSNAVTEVSRRKQALAKRPQAATLLSQAQALLAELGVEADFQ